MPPYLPYTAPPAPSWVQFRQQLASRLNDPNNKFWTDQENAFYLTEALQMWNSLTAVWLADFPFQTQNGVVWYSVPGLSGSPRVYTVTDAYAFTLMEYHLLEPPTGETWTGTPQFNISMLQNALQRRRDETIQIGNCNIAQLNPISTSPNQRRTVLPQNVMEVRRIRYVPATGSGLTPSTLWPEDGMSFQQFSPTYLQTIGRPQSYAIVSAPPLAFDVNAAAQVPGTYDVLGLLQGPQFGLAADTLLSVPDDFSWVPKWGALGDLLGGESEATDPLRASYCQNRYNDGLKLISAQQWMVLGQLNGVATDAISLTEMDTFYPEWDSSSVAPPSIIMPGVDFVGISPPPGSSPVGVVLTLVQNAPIPANDAAAVQASPDVLDVLLDYAQHVAAFKQGGAEFTDTYPLLKNFVTAATKTNARLNEMGIFSDVLKEQSQRQTEMQPRFAESANAG